MSTPDPRSIAMADAFTAIVQSLKGESDRGTIVLAAAWLDDSLTKILRVYFNTSPSEKNSIFSPGQAIGDFGTKIKIAAKLNLINSHIEDSLSICRKLRNEFAHLASELSFQTPSVKSKIENLFQLNHSIIDAMGETFDELMNAADEAGKASIKTMRDQLGAKELFRFLCGSLSSGLAGLEFGLKASAPDYDLELLADIE
ncbi:hypothetical protein [Pseudomonas sp. G1002]|uniref:hypothetical protein n=1 Tax=Pseudomonas sp. G1002 TaxID=410942 RepID=UPI0015A2CAF8|nr:hypothetical protein [Pseudomonas sp. G1002]NWC01576.1 hypothetical protein [Pseudomonas sp. G1002]